MSSKTVMMSVRLSEDDADFLTSLKIDKAATPSDKLRAIIQQARFLEQSSVDFNDSINLLNRLSESTVRSLMESERKNNLHSDLIIKYSSWITKSFAYFITAVETHSNNLTKEELKKIEAGIAARTFELIENILRLGVTEEAPCYDSKIISKNLDRILEITNIISLYRKSKEEKEK